MAKVFFVKNGSKATGNRTSEAMNKKVEEITALLPSHRWVFLTNNHEEMQFHTEHPSEDGV